MGSRWPILGSLEHNSKKFQSYKLETWYRHLGQVTECKKAKIPPMGVSCPALQCYICLFIRCFASPQWPPELIAAKVYQFDNDMHSLGSLHSEYFLVLLFKNLHVCTRTHLHAHIHGCTCTRTHTHTHTHMHARTHTHTHTHTLGLSEKEDRRLYIAGCHAIIVIVKILVSSSRAMFIQRSSRQSTRMLLHHACLFMCAQCRIHSTASHLSLWICNTLLFCLIKKLSSVMNLYYIPYSP